jgi:AcrR family transcriptional regulator
VRTVGTNRDDTWERVRAAGVDLLYRHGFEAMNVRKLAEASGLTSGSLYYYFSGKEEFLHRLLVDLLSEIVADLEEGLEGITRADQRLEKYVRILVKWHVQRREETSIARIEVRSLTDERHQSYMALRRRFDAVLSEILEDGVAQGVFDLTHPSISRNALLSALTGICGWYDPQGSLGQAEIEEDFVVLARRLVGQRTPRRRAKVG